MEGPGSTVHLIEVLLSEVFRAVRRNAATLTMSLMLAGIRTNRYGKRNAGWYLIDFARPPRQPRAYCFRAAASPPRAHQSAPAPTGISGRICQAARNRAG